MSINAISKGTLASTEPPNISLDETSLIVAGEEIQNYQLGTEGIQEMDTGSCSGPRFELHQDLHGFRMTDECPVNEFDHNSIMEVCVVCGDRASGRHYGAMSCEGCKGFFKRSIRKENGYLCKGNKDCEVNKSQRNRCQHCRLGKCIAMGMRGDSVQTERRPGRPSLNGKKKKVMPENYNWVDNVGDELGEELKEIDGDFINEKAIIMKSLSELKSNLNDKMVPFHNNSQSINPNMFDNLHLSLVKFQLPFPLPTPFQLNSQFVCETASRLLFLSIHWARKIPVYQSLPYSTQVSLLKSSWADLFILSLALCKDQINLPSLLTAVASHLQTCLGQDNLSLTRTRKLVDTLAKIKNIVNKVDELVLEPEEFAYLRLCSLFGSDQTSESLLAVTEPISDCVLSSFRTYYERKKGHKEGRFARLLLHTVPLRSFPPDMLEELFFSGLVGNVKIESVLPYILGMETGEQGKDENEEESEDDNIEEPN